MTYAKEQMIEREGKFKLSRYRLFFFFFKNKKKTPDDTFFTYSQTHTHRLGKRVPHVKNT
jgi:hypothetical protein